MSYLDVLYCSLWAVAVLGVFGGVFISIIDERMEHESLLKILMGGGIICAGIAIVMLIFKSLTEKG